ncbi:MAG: hypothetical protein ACPGYT_00020 [Nitrospirales bacterium]
MSEFQQIIGIDLDNTIINYDELFYQLACERGFIDTYTPHCKREIRDRVRSRSTGDDDWWNLQVTVYGERILEAVPSAGVLQFFERANARSIPIFIISHKTQHPSKKKTDIDFRKAAWTWLRAQKIIGDHKWSIPHAHVFFEDTRELKVKRIVRQKCTCFIDDLHETFCEPHFPDGVEQLWFHPGGDAKDRHSRVLPYETWKELDHYCFPL